MNIRNTAEAAVEMFPILHDLSLKNNLLTRKQCTVEKRQDIHTIFAC